MKTARYVGGPLDGQTVEKARGRWSIYRDDDGQQISTARGDKEFYAGPRLGRPVTRYYTHQERLIPGTAESEDLYIHGTAWKSWKETNG